MVLFQNRDYFINLDKLGGTDVDSRTNTQQPQILKSKRYSFLTLLKLRIILTFLYGFLVSKAIVVILMIFIFYSFENLTNLGILEKYSILAYIIANILIYIWSFVSIWLPKRFNITPVIILVNLTSLVILFMLNIYFINKMIHLYGNDVKLDKMLISIMKSYYLMIIISFFIFLIFDFVLICLLCLYFKKYNAKKGKMETNNLKI